MSDLLGLTGQPSHVVVGALLVSGMSLLTVVALALKASRATRRRFSDLHMRELLFASLLQADRRIEEERKTSTATADTRADRSVAVADKRA